MHKRIVILGLLLCLLTHKVLADDQIEFIEEEEITEAVSNMKEEEIPNINARAAIIYDRITGEIIWGKKEKEKRPMASTTKIMTAIIVIENCNLQETIEVSKKAGGTGGSRLGLKAGDKITIQDLLYGLMLRSGNDAAVALAECVGGSLEGFAEKMNQKARELHLESTHFVTPHGLDEQEHYTTAFELAKLTDYALKNEVFAQIVGTKNATITINGYPKTLANTNELLGYLDGVYGVKTGFTNGANRCLVTAIKREGMDIITVVLGADTKKFRTTDSIKLINYAYQNYEVISIENKLKEEFQKWKEEVKEKIIINKGKKIDVEIELEKLNNPQIVIPKKEEEDIHIEIEQINYLEAPVIEGKIIGCLKVYVGEEKKIVLNISIKTAIEKKNVLDYIIEIVENWKEYFR